MNIRSIIAVGVGLLSSVYATGEVVTYPAGKDVETIDDFTVSVRQNGGEWLPVAVYPVKVDEVRDTKHHVETASMAYFDFGGMPVDVRVISKKSVDTARIRPLSYDITPDVKGDTLFFSLAQPRNLSVEVNGDIFHNLHLFANPIDINRPSATIVSMTVPSGLCPTDFKAWPSMRVIEYPRLSVAIGDRASSRAAVASSL